MFKVTWINYGELDFRSTDFCSIVYDVSEHTIFYETCNGIKHALRCDFGSIFNEIRSIVSSDEFQNEKPYKDGCDGSWYKFEYTLMDYSSGGKEVQVQYEGYIYGLKCHEEVISLIKSCAKSTLKDERKLLEHRCTDNEMQDIIKKRQELEEDFLDWWIDIEKKSEDIFYNPNRVKMRLEDDSSDCWKGILSEIQLPNGFIKCSKCNSIIHNKYYKNRKYWGRVWLSDDELGEYEVEYESGECPVCGQLNTELPYSGLDFQPDSFENNQDNIFDSDDEDKLYSLAEVDSYLKNLSEDDRSKLKDCQFKLHKDYPDDDSGEVYYSFRIYRNNIIVGWIDMNSYTLTLYEDSKENFSSENIKNPFDDLKLRCKKCGKVFCTCNKFFTRKD